MVRINLIEPNELTDQHLRAEYLEIIMLFKSLKRMTKSIIPEKYVLGKGHMSFFKDKVSFLVDRHLKLRQEMGLRGFKSRHFIVLDKIAKKEGYFNIKIEKDRIATGYMIEVSKELCKDYIPSESEIELNRKRIKEKIDLKPSWYRYYGKRLVSKPF